MSATAADSLAAIRDYLSASGVFDAAWYAERVPEAKAWPGGVLEHYLEQGRSAGQAPNAVWEAAQSCAASPPEPATAGDVDPVPAEFDMALIAASGAFDADYYLANNHDVAANGLDPLAHFCRHGWKELRNPSRSFDVWWYWASHLDPASERVNPLVHYVSLGAARGLAAKPESIPRTTTSAPLSAPRRICLFAGYDADGRVDDYVVRYVRELSRHADVYYLADCWMAPEELERLAPFVKGAWADRHGTYDFGSWSRLATTYVGWESISGYDEVLLVNDSCYLVRALDEVFAKMDATACDWWGLQATKGIAATRDVPANRFQQRIPLNEVVREWLPRYESDYTYDFLVGSYFLAFRKPAASDAVFRKLLSRVVQQRGKKLIIQKYEIGLTRLLLSRGFLPATYVDWLYPFHPIFSETHFALLEEGFPVFKRYLLSDNHYLAVDLSSWKSRIQAIVAEAPVEEMERNLLRVADDDKLQRSFSVRIAGDGKPLATKLLTGDEMAREDKRTPKFDHWWAFPVCAYDHLLTGNERAVFEQVRNDPSIKKIVLTRRRWVSLEGENVVVCPLDSPEGQYHLLRAKQIFVKHSPRINAKYPISAKLHNFINLWHGIPLKRFGPASLDMEQKLEWVYRENRDCRAVISSSKVDALAMAAAFYPLPYRDVWITGLPRNDFIVCAESRLPSDFLAEGRRLEAERAGRKLVLFAPTFKNAQADGYYRFSDDELDWLRGWLQANDAVLGVREHMADRAHAYYAQLSSLGALDLSAARYPNIEVLYRQSAALVTDYSSCAIDFMLTGRPVVSFAYDLEHYAGSERGLFYDLDHVFPGPVCRDFGSLSVALSGVFDSLRESVETGLRHRTFFDYDDDGSARRVVHRVRTLGSDATPRPVRA
ncbi:CDP-glycerol glycerophosphotransferase family protein [Luteimonas sp. SDU101]|uniref:CDP-glycerol glycerophosphotransferase family protein n=1 Tax=Luteimonas sp. SDU101 TaxID=3422593 RepID=UPI003EBD432D